MKLAIVLILVLLVYFLDVRKIYRTYKATPAENRKELQSVPMFLSSTFVYVAITVQLIRLSVQGYLPLL